MLVIVCPNCGPRNSDEYAYQGERLARPDAGTAKPGEWRHYLYMKANESSWVTERWFHTSGCRRFLMVERHATSNEIRSVRQVGETT